MLEPSADHALALALRLANAGQPARAVQLCEHALAAPGGGDHPGLLQLLALLSLGQGRTERAAECAEASLARRPDHLATLLIAGDAARALGRTDTAVEHHRRARALAPERADVAAALGSSLRDAGRAPEAESLLAEAVRRDPRQVEAAFALGLLRHDRRDHAGAAAALRHVLAHAPPRAEVEVNLGIVLQDAGRLDEAMQAYGRACRLDPRTFGRVAHALAAANHGRLWLDAAALHAALATAAGAPAEQGTGS